MSHGEQDGEWNQSLIGNGLRVRFGDVTASTLIAGVRGLGNILRESFIQPRGNAIGIKSVHDQMNDFVPESVIGKFLRRIALNEKTPFGMNASRPPLQIPEYLKLLPFLRSLENVNMRLDVPWRRLALQLFCHHPVVKFGFHGDGSDDVTVDEMVDEMFGLSVFPLVRMNGERFFAERIGVALA